MYTKTYLKCEKQFKNIRHEKEDINWIQNIKFSYDNKMRMPIKN
jgi:hypothetical protein